MQKNAKLFEMNNKKRAKHQKETTNFFGEQQMSSDRVTNSNQDELRSHNDSRT